MNNTHTHRRHLRSLARAIAAGIIAFGIPVSAQAVSSWSPTLLVNTESFESIDSGDGTTDRELRFGDTNNERLIYEINNNRFRFTRGLQVSGNITATGSIVTKRAFSGASLNIDGNATLAASGVIIGGSGGTVFNEQSRNVNFRIEGDTDQALVFVQASTDRVGVGTSSPDTKFEVVGTISGSTVYAKDALRSSGSLVFEGAASGASLYLGTRLDGAGLTDCDNGTTAKLLWDSTTGRFSCGTDTGSAGGSFGSGNVLTLGDNRYVNVSGDTMTGQLVIDSVNALSISGTLLFNDAGYDVDARFEGDTDQNLLFLDASTDRIGIGTATPDAKLDVIGSISGTSLTINGATNIRGALSASGQIRTEGNLSGNTLTVDGAVTLRGQTYNFPTSQPSSGGVLRTDGAGNLTWSNSIANGSGDLMSLHPEYPNAIYFGSGSNQIGQLTMSGGTSALDNSYVWTSSRGTIQDYWISVRAQLPKNFGGWDPVTAMQLRYKTGVNSAANNHLTVRIKDTAGANVTGTGGLWNTSWTTANIPGPATTGTWTPGGYFTVYVKVAADSTTNANAAAGFLNFNWETKTP